MKISFVIPCYYAEKNIEPVVNNIISYVINNKLDYEIVLVNDGSTDRTFEIISEISKKYPNIIGINLTTNMGQHNAIMAGLRFCSGDYIMIVTDDGQTPLEVIPSMIEQIQNGKDVVCVKYVSREKRSWFRRIGTKINTIITDWLITRPKGIEFSIDLMMTKVIAKEIVKYKGPYTYFPGLVFRTTQNISNVEAEQHKRSFGKSGYTINKLIKLFMNGFTAFSVKPLRISMFLGMIMSLVGFVSAIMLIIRRIVDSTVQVGWSSIIVLLLFVSGVMMMMIGLIGEYLGRIYMCINNAPQYVIKEIITTEKN